ncbi:MAG: DUF4157 domain-containing protein, partial [Bacteroidota bacterium]
MHQQTNKKSTNKSRAAANTTPQAGKSVAQFVKKNDTGLPDDLKAGIENLSGYAMDDVKVHYNSSQPAQLQAHAYAQGTDIHLGPGQEKHLPHEAWHVVQQKQGRVQPTRQMKGKVQVNDEQGLEREADVMGNKALNTTLPPQQQEETIQSGASLISHTAQFVPVIQRAKIEPKGVQGLTHLVKMIEGNHLYNGDNWSDNEGVEVKTGDKLLVDEDDAWDSRRGIDQETNWEQDGQGEASHLWLRVLELNHAPVEPVEENWYVRAEMLSEGWPDWEEGPKTMHSIWVQGDFRKNEEALQGIETHRGEDTEGWVDMIWLYNSGVDQGAYKPEKVEIDSAKLSPLMQRSFKHEMAIWKESGNMPEWVENWLPILDVLYEKKSFVTMSDLMRMIILYYEGGVYMDVKIKVQPDKALFKERPMLKVNQVNFYARENWAIMAHAGAQMIEEMMIEAYKQFPNVDELATYPENYNDPKPVGGRKREGKMHVELHEKLGVWNVIEKKGRPTFPT